MLGSERNHCALQRRSGCGAVLVRLLELREKIAEVFFGLRGGLSGGLWAWDQFRSRLIA